LEEEEGREIPEVEGPKGGEGPAAASSGLGFLHSRECVIGGIPLRLFRLSFTGLPGYELHCDASDANALYHHIRGHRASLGYGLDGFGSYAVNSHRIEKGFKLRLDIDFAHYKSAGIEAFVVEGKAGGGFLGEGAPDALPRESIIFEVVSSSTPAASLPMQDPWRWSLPGDAPIMETLEGGGAGRVLGVVTSGALGATTGKTIGMGYLHQHHHESCHWKVGGRLPRCHVEAYGNKWEINILKQPPVPVYTRASQMQSPKMFAYR
jgi:dimethylglycine dehydrogenase